MTMRDYSEVFRTRFLDRDDETGNGTARVTNDRVEDFQKKLRHEEDLTFWGEVSRGGSMESECWSLRVSQQPQNSIGL